MSEKDKKHYYAVKADPERYALYLARKARERKANPARRAYQNTRHKIWRLKHPEKTKAIRQAGHRVEAELKMGRITRPATCSSCGATGKIEAHHHKGYAPEHWLDIVWLCVMCHRKADAEKSFFEPHTL